MHIQSHYECIPNGDRRFPFIYMNRVVNKNFVKLQGDMQKLNGNHVILNSLCVLLINELCFTRYIVTFSCETVVPAITPHAPQLTNYRSWSIYMYFLKIFFNVH